MGRHRRSVEQIVGKPRDELINREIFETLLETKVLIERLRGQYNRFRPNSSLGYRWQVPEGVLVYAP